MPIYKTENLGEILGVLHLCYEELESGVILGKAGSGKTTSIRSFVDKKPGVLYLEVGDDAYSRKDLLLALVEAAGSAPASKSIQLLKKQLIDIIQTKHYRLVVIDQANFIPTSVVNVLSCIQQKAPCGLLLAGTLHLDSIIKKSHLAGELEQYTTRVSYKYEAALVSRPDVVTFLKAEGIEEGPEFEAVTETLLRKAAGSGQFRTVVKTIAVARKLVKNSKAEKMTPAHVSKAIGLVV